MHVHSFELVESDFTRVFDRRDFVSHQTGSKSKIKTIVFRVKKLELCEIILNLLLLIVESSHVTNHLDPRICHPLLLPLVNNGITSIKPNFDFEICSGIVNHVGHGGALIRHTLNRAND